MARAAHTMRLREYQQTHAQTYHAIHTSELLNYIMFGPNYMRIVDTYIRQGLPARRGRPDLRRYHHLPREVRRAVRAITPSRAAGRPRRKHPCTHVRLHACAMRPLSRVLETPHHWRCYVPARVLKPPGQPVAVHYEHATEPRPRPHVFRGHQQHTWSHTVFSVPHTRRQYFLRLSTLSRNRPSYWAGFLGTVGLALPSTLMTPPAVSEMDTPVGVQPGHTRRLGKQ